MVINRNVGWPNLNLGGALTKSGDRWVDAKCRCQRILLSWLWGLMAIPISCQTSLPRNTIGDMRQRMMRHEVRYESGVDYSYSPANCIFSTRGPMSRRESEGESTRWLQIMTLSNMTPRITFEGVFFCSHPYILIWLAIRLPLSA